MSTFNLRRVTHHFHGDRYTDHVDFITVDRINDYIDNLLKQEDIGYLSVATPIISTDGILNWVETIEITEIVEDV